MGTACLNLALNEAAAAAADAAIAVAVADVADANCGSANRSRVAFTASQALAR